MPQAVSVGSRLHRGWWKDFGDQLMVWDSLVGKTPASPHPCRSAASHVPGATQRHRLLTAVRPACCLLILLLLGYITSWQREKGGASERGNVVCTQRLSPCSLTVFCCESAQAVASFFSLFFLEPLHHPNLVTVIAVIWTFLFVFIILWCYWACMKLGATEAASILLLWN